MARGGVSQRALVRTFQLCSFLFFTTISGSRNLRAPLTALIYRRASLDLLECIYRDILWHGAAWRQAARRGASWRASSSASTGEASNSTARRGAPAWRGSASKLAHRGGVATINSPTSGAY